MPISRSDIAEAHSVLGTSNRFSLLQSAQPEKNAAVRVAAAMNLHTDYEELQTLSVDPEPLIADIAKGRLEELEHLVKLYRMWAADNPCRADADSSKPMDALGMAALRHMTGSNAERLTVAECIDLVRKTIQI